MKNKINIVFLILTAVLLFFSGLIPLETNYYYKCIQISGYVITIAYFIINLIRRKNIKIIKNKLDICVILLTLSTAIPLIFNTYVSLYGTINVIIQYTYALTLYFLLREITGSVKGLGKIITNFLIISVVISIFIGLDGITLNNTAELLKSVKMVLSENGDNRLVSTFGCANAIAIYIASVLFLNFNEALNHKKAPLKALYKTITFIFLVGIILTYSKAVLVLLAFTVLLYIIMLKDKVKRIELIENLVIALIMTLMFIMAFDVLFNYGCYILIWIAFVILIILNYIINLVFEKLNTYIEKINLKQIVIIFGTLTFTALVYVILGLCLYDKYVVFGNNIPSNYEVKIINNIDGNTKYSLAFDILSQAAEDFQDMYTIKVIEKDVKNQIIQEHKVDFGEYVGKQNIEFVTQDKTTELRIEFKLNYEVEEKSLIVNSLTINEKNIPLKYKLLPTKLVEKIKSINLNYKTLQERKEMVVNAAELSKDNILTGIGGDGWLYKYKEVQTYNYTARKLHSYPAKVLLEFGLLGIVSYLGIMLILAIQLFKNKNSNIQAVIFSLFVLMLHAIIDTDMEYIHLLIYAFGLLGVISNEVNSEKCKSKDKTKNRIIIVIISNVIVVSLMVVSIYIKVNMKIYNPSENVSNLLKQRNGLRITSNEYLDINRQMAEEYEKILSKERYSHIQIYGKILDYYINSNATNKMEIVEKYYEKILAYENKNKNDVESILSKLIVVRGVIRDLERLRDSKYYEITEKYINIILDEYEKTKKELVECLERQHITDVGAIDATELEYIYQYAKSIKSTYLLGTRIYNESQITIDEEKLKNIKIELGKDILIYHTHGTESFKSDEEYETYKFYRSTDENYNVIRIGKHLNKLLKEKGFNVIHETGYYDLPSTSGAYGRSKEKVEEILSKTPNIDLLIDVHRDALSETEHIADTVNINGESVAILRFVVGINLEDEDWMDHLKLAIELQKLADKIYPGLFKPILIRDIEYNQDILKYSLLIEVGENCNMLEDALDSTEYFAEIINKYCNK